MLQSSLIHFIKKPTTTKKRTQKINKEKKSSKNQKKRPESPEAEQ